MTRTKHLLTTTFLTALTALSYGYAKADEIEETDPHEEWDVNNPPGEKRTIDIDVDEGTWMSLDVSPDGKTIAFDLLGDIYTIPATGGTATNIASGLAWDYQPRFSPDGSKIAFTSDRAGGDNIWIMNPDGSDAEQITSESFRLLNNPTWSPDGRYIAARKHFTTSRSLGTGEIWLYHTAGGSGVQLVERPSDTHQKELGEPMFSPDGRYIYYSQNTTSGPIFEYAQDSNTELFQIKRYDMETGNITKAAGGAGGAVRPTPSPDGKWLAYVKRVRAKSMLFIKDLKSGKEKMIFDHLDRDMQETWAVQGVYPNMDWSPDSKSLYFWAGGKIHRLDVADNNIEHIEFTVKDTREIMNVPRPDVDISPDTFPSKMPRFVQMSPDGRRVVYENQGKLWVRSTDGTTARRLTGLADNIREVDPAWSRDGQRIVFATWNDTDLGAIRSINVGTKSVRKLTVDPGHYRRPALSPDGSVVMFEKLDGGNLISEDWSAETGLYKVGASGGTPKRIRTSGRAPHFGAENDRVYFTGGSGGNTALISTDMSGNEERVHTSSQMAQSYVIAPDSRHIAVRENYDLYVMPVLPGPQNVTAGPKGSALPVRKASTGGATYPSWKRDGKTVYWSLGPNLYKAEITALRDEEDDAVESLPKISPTLKKDVPSGKIAITNARIITMADSDGGVIENGTILIDGDRIAAIGADIEMPAGVKTVDAAGKTIIPGLIDAHAHGPQGVGDMTPNQNWETVATLALGVTTAFDPSTSAASFFPAAEMQRTGKLRAPRLFSTGEVIYGARAPGFFAEINNYEEAKQHVSRLREQGAHGVKNYNQPRREQRQQVTQAAREYDMLVVPEGGSLYHMDMSLIADGNSSVEHNLPVGEIYDDVVQMYAQSGVAYVPTVVVTYGGVRGEDYYYQESEVWKHPILSKHVPPAILQSRAVRRQMVPEEDYADDDTGRVAKKLMENGVLVTIGAHGQREGLAAHWEMWSFARGGMSPVQALQTATVDPAKHLGFWKDVGSLEKGKLADLVILNENPLDNILNTDKIDKVMLGGRLYDAETMNEEVTGNAKRLPYWWEAED